MPALIVEPAQGMECCFVLGETPKLTSACESSFRYGPRWV